MKFLQKRPVAAAIMVLAILAGLALGGARKPSGQAGVAGEFLYIIHNEDGVISRETAEYIEAMNASLFSQTGAQIAVDVVDTTGDLEIIDYADQVFTRQGIGSRERNNGILLVLALRNLYNGVPAGDYSIAWGGGFSTGQQHRLEDILFETMEDDFAAGRYDAGVRRTFDEMVDYLESVYHVTVTPVPAAAAAMGNYQTISGGYSSVGTAVRAGAVLSMLVTLLVVLLVLWVILDGMRYRSYRRRYWGPTVMGIPRPVYYPVFWGRPRPPRRPPPPRRPSRGPGGPGGFGGGTFGGGFGGGTF
ncbi:TPM domain-containing protein, partial [Oscillospiraceae bacterium 38-13]